MEENKSFLAACRELRPIVKHTNYVSWKRASIFIEVFVVAALILSFFIGRSSSEMILNGIVVAITTVALVLSRIKKEESKFLYALILITFLSIIASAATISALFYPEFAMGFYYVLLLGFSAVIIFEPLTLILYHCILSAYVIVLIMFFSKCDNPLVSCVICVVVTILSLVFNINLWISKMQNILYVQKVSKELETVQKISNRHINTLASLSKEYLTIVYVDLDKNEIIDVYAQSRQNFGRNMIGCKYTDEITQYCNDFVYVEDAQNVKNAMLDDKLKDKLENGDTITTRYRVEENGLLVYYEMKVIKGNDPDALYPIIFAARNVDVEVRLDMVFQANFADAKRNATKDLMTGVKNKGAFEGKCQELMQNISDGKYMDFAIVMCDVNGLKKLNDTEGHDAGDKLIKDVCHIVSTIYSHSPVYRIGGDEFVAVLTGSDYNDRDELLRMARDMAVHNDKGVSFASGMAVYDITVDTDVKDVFKRADEAMYENKVAMKACRED